MKESTVKFDSNLIHIVEAINAAPAGIAFLVDEKDKFHSVFTDGDLRRMLLKEKRLSIFLPSEYLNSKSVFAREGENMMELMKMTSKKVRIIPILNLNHEVVDYFEYNHKTHFTPVAEPDLTGKEMEYLMDAFSSTWISSRGKYIDTFEADFASFCDSKHGVATSNGTVAIHLALVALGIGKGDEVIVPDLTFAATINAVLHANAKPVIVDVRKEDWTIDPIEIKKAITKNTKAIIPVHINGQPCEMDEIMSIAKDNNLKVIEDCAEAHGAKFKGQKVGSFGDINSFSFFANKIITTGEGGMCLTNSKELYSKMRILRDHGMSLNKKYWHEVVGFNYRMTNLQAAIGCAQLERIGDIIKQNQATEEKYHKVIGNSSGINWQSVFNHKSKVVWLVCGTVEKDRDLLIQKFRENGIDSRPFFYSLSEIPVYSKYSFSCKVSKEISKKGINLPVKLDSDTIDSVLNQIHDVLRTTVK